MIEIRELTRRHGGQTVINRLSLTLPDRGLVCVVGPSGCGKTTLANIIAGLDRDYTGTVTINGIELAKLDEQALDRWRADHIGFVFQDFHLVNGANAQENTLIAAGLHGLTANEAKERARRLLTGLGLADALKRPVETLSGGEQQRVAIARALMWNAPIIIADEPTGSLDAENARTIMNALASAAQKRLVIAITHDMSLLPHADIVVRVENEHILVEPSSPEPKADPNAAAKTSAIVDPGTPELLHNQPESARNEAFERTMSTARAKGTGQHTPHRLRARGIWCAGASSIKRRPARYLALAVLFSFAGALTCAALAIGATVDRSIHDFEQKNVGAFSGFVGEKASSDLLAELQADPRIAAAWGEKTLGPIEVSSGNAEVTLEQKMPTSRATESLSFGTMPRRDKAELTLSPSLARKLNADISSLVGTHVRVRVGNEDIGLTVSGIHNAGYDDIFFSSDIQERLCAQVAGDLTAIGFETESLSDIPVLHDEFASKGITVIDATETVTAVLDSFSRLRITFSAVSAAVAAVSLAAGGALCIRLQMERTAELGLRRALGFTRGEVLGICRREAAFIALTAAVFCLALVATLPLIPLPGGHLAPTVPEAIFCTLSAAIAAPLLFAVATRIALRTPPATALAAD